MILLLAGLFHSSTAATSGRVDRFQRWLIILMWEPPSTVVIRGDGIGTGGVQPSMFEGMKRPV